jgi:hypothetical protein
MPAWSDYRNYLNDPKKYYIFYIVLLSLIASYYFLRWPITAADTDLWYHLNSGRYIFENKSLPHNSFFSFISPPRAWVDYFWLFQVLVYKIYSFFDYYGLIVLRAVIYLTTVSVILCYLLKGQENKSLSYFILIFLLYFFLLIPRSLILRPHVFSYLFIVVFLYILEFKPRKAIYLPVLSILWANLQGIEYPVMLLITLSYALEFLLKHVRDKTLFTKSGLFYFVPLVLSMGGFLLTPHGINLVGVPFISTEYASDYVNELRRLRLSDFFTFNITAGSPQYFTIFNLLLVAAFSGVVVSVFKKRIRISHLLMIAGGTILLTKGIRFVNEFVLLAMPVISANIPVPANTANKKVIKSSYIFLVIILAAMPFMLLKSIFANPPKYPLTHWKLPEGVVTFLKNINANGYVLNHPNTGGYLQWMLYPKCKIFMDMEVPLLFTDEDFYVATNVFGNEEVLRKVISEYNPAFITVPFHANHAFSKLVEKFPDYALVFFDNSEVLYVNKRSYPDIAERYEIKSMVASFTMVGPGVDPYIEFSELSKGEKVSLVMELVKFTKMNPDNNLVNRTIAMLYNGEGDYKEAMPYIDSIIRNSPELPVGYSLKGESLMGLRLYEEAISYYKMALERSLEDTEKSDLYRNLWVCYTNLKRYKKAFDVFKKTVDIFSARTNYKDLYDFGLSAYRAGKAKEAQMLFKFADLKVPSNDVEWKEKIRKAIAGELKGDTGESY